MRKRIIISALLGIICCGISGIIFVLSSNLLTFALGLLILFPGLFGSCIAFFLTTFHILRQSILKTDIHLQSTHETERVHQIGKRIRIVRANRAERIKNLKLMVLPLGVLIILVLMSEVLPNIAEPFVNSQHFGAFVAFPLLIVSSLALLYGIFLKDTFFNRYNELR
jgi:hypothetical protein